jgi:hypothetical protein
LLVLAESIFNACLINSSHRNTYQSIRISLDIPEYTTISFFGGISDKTSVDTAARMNEESKFGDRLILSFFR